MNNIKNKPDSNESLENLRSEIKWRARIIGCELLYTGQSIKDFRDINNIPNLIADSIKDCIDSYVDTRYPTTKQLSYLVMEINPDARRKVKGMGDLETRTFIKSLMVWDREGEPLLMSASADECKAALDRFPSDFYSQLLNEVTEREANLPSELFNKKWEVTVQAESKSLFEIETWKTDELKIFGMDLRLAVFTKNEAFRENYTNFFRQIRRPGKTMCVAIYGNEDQFINSAKLNITEIIADAGMSLAYRYTEGDLEGDAGIEYDLKEFTGMDFVLCYMGEKDREFLSHADIVIVNTAEALRRGQGIYSIPPDYNCGIEADVNFSIHLSGQRLSALNSEIARRTSLKAANNVIESMQLENSNRSTRECL